ncbi:MAG: AraC family ligand binding domain-containing protein [Methanomicrobiales archaeon]|nr:AraC family ligand binding domain-containing protein [Methanomicrobiales archaeon]
MKNILPPLLFISLLLVSAGCTSSTPEKSDSTGQVLISPSPPFPIFEGLGQYAYIIENDSPLGLNYSLGYVTLTPGNATPPHLLLGTSELVYVIGGTARIRSDNETIPLNAGELALLREGALQSIDAVGPAELRYLSVNQPPYRGEIDIRGEDLAAVPALSGGSPIVVRNPAEGIEWDYHTGTLIYTLVNPMLMPEKDIPINYSVAYAEILPGGHVAKNRLIGLSELIYVIESEIVITSPGGEELRVPAGSAGFVPMNTVKEYTNPGTVNAKILSFTDPAWQPEKAEILE